MAEFNPEADKWEDEELNSARQERINCIKCVYYEVTWDPANPHGCIMFGFKGKKLPSETVKDTTGKTCPSFILKHRK